jgi:hypothetical protein
LFFCKTPAAQILPAAFTAQLGGSSSSTRQPQRNGATAADSAAAPTPAAAAAPQTPWVVHFSQMGDDSIYGMPEQPSPTAHQRLKEQLQEQQYQEQQLLLQPIVEEQSQDVSPAPALPPPQQRAAFASVFNAPAAAGALTLDAHAHCMSQHRPHALQLPGAERAPDSSRDGFSLAAGQHRAAPLAAAAAACGQQLAPVSKQDRSRAAFDSILAAPGTAENSNFETVQELAQVVGDSRCSAVSNDLSTGGATMQPAGTPGHNHTRAGMAAAAAAAGMPAPASALQQSYQPQVYMQQQRQDVQQQQKQQQQQQQLHVASGGCGSVDELISALRRVTSDGRRSTSEVMASPMPAVTPPAAAAAAALATPSYGHHNPLLQHRRQETPVARGAEAASIGVVPSFGSIRQANSTVDELIGALQRVTDSSRRNTAEAAPAAAAAGMHTPGELPLQQQQQAVAANSSLFGSLSNVDELIVALRRATSDNARTAAMTEGTPQGSQNPFILPSLQQQQQQRPWEQAAATPPHLQPQQLQAIYPGSAAGAGGPVPAAPSSVDELIVALRRATGDSRRSTAEAAPSPLGMQRREPQQLWMGQQGSSHPGGLAQSDGLYGSMSGVDELLGALRRATDSRRGTAESALDAPAGMADTTAAAAAAAVAAVKQKPGVGQESDVPAEAAAGAAVGAAGLFGGMRSVDDLLGALRRATDSRRGTAELAPDAPAGMADTSAAAADVAAVKQKAEIRQSSDVSAAATVGVAGLFGSISSVDDLLGALRRATDSRRGKAESAPDAPAGMADTSAAAAAGDAAVKQQAGTGQDSDASAAAAAGAAGGYADLFGSMSSVDVLLGALQRATGDSRRGTAESAPDAPAGTANTSAVAGAAVEQRSQVGQGLSGTGVPTEPAAEPAGLFGSLSSVDDLIQALSSATGDGRHDTGKAEGKAAAAVLKLQQQNEAGAGQLQQVVAASDSVRRSSLGSSSNFEDVLASLLRATAASSRRGTAEAVAGAAAVPLDSQPSQQQQQVQGQQAVMPGSKGPSNAGCSPAYMSGNSINQLVSSLRRVTAESQGKLKAAAEAMTPPPQQPPAMQAAAAAADTPEAAAAAAGRADMQELVAALQRVTGEDQAHLCSSTGAYAGSTPARLSATPLAIGQASSGAQENHQEQQQQRQHHVLIQQLLLQTQQQNHDEQLCWQQQGSFNGCHKATWGSIGGGEAPPAFAAAAATTSSGGLEQLLAALQGAAGGEGLPVMNAASNAQTAEPAQHAALNVKYARSSAAELELLLRGQQQQQQLQAVAVANGEVQTTCGPSSCHSPIAAAEVLGNMPANYTTTSQQQQQQQLSQGMAVELDPSQSPLRARQLWQDEPAPGSAEECSNAGLSLSQLVHALQSTGDHQASSDEAAPIPAALPASPAAADMATAAVTVDNTSSKQHMSSVARAEAADAVGDGLASSDLYRFPASTPVEQPLQPAAEPAQQQTAETQHPAHAAAEPVHQPQQQMPLPAEAAAQADNPAGELQESAVPGMQLCSVSSMAVAFDPCIAAQLKQQLAAAVAAAGGCVVPGQPHLGCGANTVVAEPQHAAQWLQLLMHIVSPAWLLKACRQQQQQQGGRAQQQLMCLSPDIARALGQGKQQQVLQRHSDAVSGGAAAAVGSRECAEGNSSTASTPTGTAAINNTTSSSNAAHAAQVPGGNSSSSSKACRRVLAVPGGLSVDDGMGLCMAAAGAGAAGQQQQQALLMPPGLLEGIVWSVDQDPRCGCCCSALLGPA